MINNKKDYLENLLSYVKSKKFIIDFEVLQKENINNDYIFIHSRDNKLTLNKDDYTIAKSQPNLEKLKDNFFNVYLLISYYTNYFDIITDDNNYSSGLLSYNLLDDYMLVDILSLKINLKKFILKIPLYRINDKIGKILIENYTDLLLISNIDELTNNLYKKLVNLKNLDYDKIEISTAGLFRIVMSFNNKETEYFNNSNYFKIINSGLKQMPYFLDHLFDTDQNLTNVSIVVGDGFYINLMDEKKKKNIKTLKNITFSSEKSFYKFGKRILYLLDSDDIKNKIIITNQLRNQLLLDRKSNNYFKGEFNNIKTVTDVNYIIKKD